MWPTTGCAYGSSVAPACGSGGLRHGDGGQKGAQMIAVMVFVIVGVWCLLIGLGKARVSKNPEASAAWLNKWGIVFRIGGPIMAVPSGS